MRKTCILSRPFGCVCRPSSGTRCFSVRWYCRRGSFIFLCMTWRQMLIWCRILWADVKRHLVISELMPEQKALISYLFHLGWLNERLKPSDCWLFSLSIQKFFRGYRQFPLESCIQDFSIVRWGSLWHVFRNLGPCCHRNVCVLLLNPIFWITLVLLVVSA